ncbi:MAG: CBS domain-containing protein [Nitrospiraceae bacterium]|nr:CBS domain-containing protein [Nitrospiraceae bacterium]
MKAKDLMVPLREYLTPDNTLKEAVNLLKTAKRGEERVGVKGLPVLDPAGRLAGMLSMTDILRAVFPSYMALMELGEFTWDGMLESMAKKAADKKVAQFMTRGVITVREDSPLMECVDHMIKHHVRRLPVIGASGGITGMLYERDVFFAITGAMLDDGGRDGQ